MKRAKFLLLASVLVAGLLAWLSFGASGAQAQSDQPQPLPQGVLVAGNVTNRYGEEWALYGCAGDVVTATMQSTAFAPNLELYPPVGRTPLAATDNTAQRSAQLADVTLPANGEYILAALGSSARDRGAYSLTLEISGMAPPPDDVRLLTPGATESGAVSSRFGDEWGFRGCEQDTITVTVESRAFSPLLELFGPTGRDPLATGELSSTGGDAAIPAFALPQTGDYTILAAGQSIRDRGPYTLTLLMTAGSATPTQAEPTGPVVKPARTPATATPTRPQEPLCTVVAAGGLRLRGGPGQNYPVIGTLQLNAQLRPGARDAANTWIEVKPVGAAQGGWVSAAAQFVSCNLAVSTLPLGVIPPTPIPPTPTFTPTPVPPTATPIPVAVEPGLPQPEGVLVQGPGGNPGNLAGDIYTAPGTLAGYRDGRPIFRDRLYFEMFVFDPAYGAGSGAGIDSVTFNIYCPDGGSYSRTERNARFCSFGGGEPNCDAIRLEPGAFLPDSDCQIVDGGGYSASIDAFPSDQRRREGNWNFSFAVDLPGDGGGTTPVEPQSLVAYIEQIDQGSPATLIFQVTAYDPTVGGADGDGIENVDLYIYGPDGGEVYHRTENNAHYCAFGGGEPDCNVFDLQGNDRWPENGPEIQNGTHTLYAVVHANDGRSTEVYGSVEIQNR